MNNSKHHNHFHPTCSSEAIALTPIILKSASPFLFGMTALGRMPRLEGYGVRGLNLFVKKGYHVAAILRMDQQRKVQFRRYFRSPIDFFSGLCRRPDILIGGLAKALLKIVMLFHIWYVSLIVLLCGLFTFLNPAVTGIMATRAFFDGHEVKPTVFIPRSAIPRSLQKSFIRLEDHQFYEHPGISLGAIREALERNAKLGSMVFGGSTITQQTARTIFLNSDRNIVRKYLELLAVFPMEWILGKNRIMELYLNYIEFGRGAFGLGRGALFQYGRSFSKLSAEERIRLAVIITSPIRFNVTNFRKQPGMAARYRALTQ